MATIAHINTKFDTEFAVDILTEMSSYCALTFGMFFQNFIFFKPFLFIVGKEYRKNPITFPTYMVLDGFPDFLDDFHILLEKYLQII